MKIGNRFEKADKDLNIYKKRKEVLKILGFLTYKDYLKSELWQEIIEKMFYYYKEKCFCCKRKSCLSVHHEKYTEENMSSKSLEHLFLLCRKCHYVVEFTKSGVKRKRPIKIKISNKRNIYINV